MPFPLIFRITIASLLMLPLTSCTIRTLHEKDYQNWWCGRNNGTAEFRLDDGTRVDCMTLDHAVEVEYAHKWAEAIGQSLYYARKTGRSPGIVVIVRDKGDERFLKRIRVVAKEQGIKVWTARPRDID